MASRSYRIPSAEKPTFFNIEAAIGTGIWPGVGTVIGAFMGKGRMEREAQYGKIVDKPTFFNKGFFAGLLFVPTVLAAGFAIGGMALTGGAVAVAAAIPSAITWGLARKGAMEHRYEAAQAMYEGRQHQGDVRAQAQALAQERAQQFGVTEQEMAQLNDRLRSGQGQQVSHAAQVESAREASPYTEATR